MAQSRMLTLPLLRGPLLSAGPWAALLAQTGKRIYPFPLGAMVKTTSTGTTVAMHGLGQPFEVNDYVVVCNATSYGDSTLFIPDMDKIRRITAVSSTNDEITVGSAVDVLVGDYILNIGADGAAAPLTDPNFDAILTLYDDPNGVTTNALGYLQTGPGGHFRGWVGPENRLADILVTDSSGVPEVVVPYWALGPVADNTVFTLENSATPSVKNGHFFVTGGTTTITNFLDGAVGQTIRILAAHTLSITDSATLVMAGNFSMTAGDVITFQKFATATWHEVSRSDNA